MYNKRRKKDWKGGYGYRSDHDPQPNVGVSVEAYEGESFESLMRRFKRKVSKSGLLLDVKLKAFYESHGTKKRKKRAAAIRRKAKESVEEKSARREK